MTTAFRMFHCGHFQWTPLLLFGVLVLSNICHAQRRTKRTAIIPGDIMIGALFSVHHAPGQKQAQTRTCGEIREQYGIQRVEASFQTIDEINRNQTLLPNITLGIEIRDSCWYSPIALDQSIEFIRDAIKLNDDVIGEGNATAGVHVENAPECPIKPAKILKNLVGVVGPGSSTVTIQVQNLLQLFSIPQIGYSATSRDLSDKSFYKYFLRVVPSDFYQAQVMVDLVRAYNWTYVSTVHTDGAYGGSGMDAFVKLAHEAGICVAASDSVLSHADDYIYDQIVRNLQKYPNAKAVVCFCEGMTVRGLLKAMRRLNATGEFLLIGSDGWADRNDVTEEYEKEALGGISIRIHSTYDHSFDPYYFSLRPDNNARDPWFREFWEYRFNCSLPNGSGKYNKTCSGHENLRERYKQDTKMSFVKKAIYTMAYGLHDMQRAKCNTSGLCADMLPLNGSLYLQYLMNVSFVWENETVRFDENGDPPGRYDIMNFQFIPENYSYDYRHVGSWDSGKLDIFQSFRWNPKHTTNGLPESVCSKPCDKGRVKSIQTESVKCCWVCVACKENQFLEDEYTCKDCDLGWWPNENLTDCDRIPEEYIHWSDSSAIVAMTIAALGVIATFFTMVVFILHNNTPVVKSSTRELSYVILVGMYLCHGCTFPLLAKPTRASCFLTRTVPGLSFAMMYASLLTKTNRIARILAGSKKKIITKKPRFMSGTAQVVISWLLISVESCIIGAMLVLEPADSMYSYPTLDKVDLICNTTPLGIIAPLGFDFFLIAMCTVYAVKTRNVPENFNEAKFIGFTMYTTLVIWVAFVPIYFGSNSKVITLCLCISFSAIVALALLFLPKLYIILLRPEKNNRSAFTTTKDVRCHIGRGYVSSAATVSRNSSHSTSEFSLESPRNLSLDMVHKNQKPESVTRRPSMNLFVRLRISKQDKIAANVAQHIRAVRAAEALDRRTRLRRNDSFNFPGLSSTMLPVQRSTSSEDSPGGHDKKRLVGMIKQAYNEDVIEEAANHAEDVACQTSYDLLEALLPSLRKRILRSERSDTPEEEEGRRSATPCRAGACHHKKPAYGDIMRHYSVCDSTMGAAAAAFESTSFGTRSSVRPRSRTRSRTDDRVEVEYKMSSENDLVDYDAEEIISLKDMKRSKGLQILGKKGHYNKLQPSNVEGTSLNLPQEGLSEASFSPAISQDSLIDATSSIVEESASTGSDETSGSAVYKNIIINLGGVHDRSTRSMFSAPQSSTTSAANLNVLPTIADSRTFRSQESIDDSGRKSTPDVSKSPKMFSPNGNPKRFAM